MAGLSFITLLAYDYKYAFDAIRSYYDIADEILLGLDIDRLTWMGRPFQIDMTALRDFIGTVDRQRKIRIVEGNFHTEPGPMLNETRERSLLSLETRQGNWIVQIDADEVLLNGPQFKEWLLTACTSTCVVYARCIGVFKSFENKVLLIDPPEELAPVATQLRGSYTKARVTNQPEIISPLTLLHHSWGRSAEELLQKLDNWGHTGDFDIKRYFQFWQSINLSNYQQVRDFHPLYGPTWHALKLVEVG